MAFHWWASLGERSCRFCHENIYLIANKLTPSGAYVTNQRPLALELLYKRSISTEQLIDSTIDEWRRQNIDYQAEWVSILAEIWPNIEPQDQLILYVDESSVSHFFYNKRFIGSLNDTAFASAFSAIWLSENTLKPKLRNQLIGLNPWSILNFLGVIFRVHLPLFV